MKLIYIWAAMLIALAFLTACTTMPDGTNRYNGPKLGFSIGLFGASIGLTVGSDPSSAVGAAVALPVVKGLAK